jgi:hypothetical protein
LRPVARRQATNRPRLVSIATGIGSSALSPASVSSVISAVKTGCVVADPPLGDQRSLAIDEGHVVMGLGPVNATKHFQALVPPEPPRV